MHQSHNIAWNALSSNLVFVKDNRSVTPHRTDLCPLGLPTQAKALSHFARTLESAIIEFSTTERAKYPKAFPLPDDAVLIPDDILTRYCDIPFSSITRENQQLKEWLAQAQDRDSSLHYSTSQGDFADVVKVLLAENEMETLLMLARHPKVPLQDLHYLSWGHSFGWNHICHWALPSYIFFNVLLPKPELLENDKYRSLRSYPYAIRMATGSGDYDAQAYPHRAFFWGSFHRDKPVEESDPLSDPEKLHEYLKMCFRLLYRYDMLAKECGLKVDWEGEIATAVQWLWDVKTRSLEGPDGHWMTRFG
ncbi:hypothetical protein MIND_00431500 [Mycena indigotica]|uniref:Uncharacterized protein n=1 Tax=Mycena indigotica TaxID=2126181 RepID=A0A8H6SV05_9AGAR|nr:uncharacterized protein MIND_00431500 [Mycena indigotica]KAF7306403.1 hypothetical protein MIND_00431500 [Mycena indigotica]